MYHSMQISSSVVDPDPHWFCSPGSGSVLGEWGSGSRRKECYQNSKINFQNGWSTYVRMFYNMLPYLHKVYFSYNSNFLWQQILTRIWILIRIELKSWIRVRNWNQGGSETKMFKKQKVGRNARSKSHQFTRTPNFHAKFFAGSFYAVPNNEEPQNNYLPASAIKAFLVVIKN